MARATALANPFLPLFLLSCFSGQVMSVKIRGGGGGGFSMDFFHRDNPNSPLFNPKATAADRWQASLDRSRARLNYLLHATSNKSKSPEAVPVPVSPTPGDYVISFQVGTPPDTTVALILDTGSNLLWFQCFPCEKCFKQSNPLFDPSKSSTYQVLPCKSLFCQNTGHSCKSTCMFQIDYEDGSYSRGKYSMDNFAVNSSASGDYALEDMPFGCGHESGGFFWPEENGVAGFDRSNNSFVALLGKEINGKFSHCFIPTSFDGTNKLRFGDQALLLGGSTNIIELDTTFYFVELLGISVGSQRLNVTPEMFKRVNDTGGFMVDSGTMLTFLPSAAYKQLVRQLQQDVKLPPESDRQYLCFKGSRTDLMNGAIPVITFHFKGLDVPFSSISTFAEWHPEKLCLMVSIDDDLSTLGNRFQQDLNVGYDLSANEIYMSPVKCQDY